MNDTVIAVFDAKYHCEFWRPITAIRNDDIDGKAPRRATRRGRRSSIPPMHPEYPCAHCIVASVISVVLRAEIGALAVAKFPPSRE